MNLDSDTCELTTCGYFADCTYDLVSRDCARETYASLADRYCPFGPCDTCEEECE